MQSSVSENIGPDRALMLPFEGPVMLRADVAFAIGEGTFCANYLHRIEDCERPVRAFRSPGRLVAWPLVR